MAIRRIAFRVLIIAFIVVAVGTYSIAADSDVSKRIIVTGKQREQLRATPIVNRPNRPLHFYGNTVRWIHQARTR